MHLELNMAEISEALIEYVRARRRDVDQNTRVQYFVFDEDARAFEIDEVFVKMVIPERKKESEDG